MDVLKEDVHHDLHQHVDALLKERNAIYQQHEQELMKYQEELQELEEELAGKIEEVEREERRISAVQKSLEQEKKDIMESQEEIRVHRERIWQELAYIRQEIPVSSQEKKNGECKDQEEQEPPGGQEPEKPDPEAGKGSRQQEDITRMDEQTRQELPDMLRQFAITAENIFPEGEVVESTPQAYCMKIGDKELRIHMGNPPAAEILARREKNQYLIKGIRQLNLIQSDWDFSYQDNYLKCIRPFPEAIPAEIVLKECAKAVAQYFK